MRIIRSPKYLQSLQEIMEFIAKDSLLRSLEFESQLETKLNKLVDFPHRCMRINRIDHLPKEMKIGKGQKSGKAVTLHAVDFRVGEIQ